jgi:peptide/nickel transport system permease protein
MIGMPVARDLRSGPIQGLRPFLSPASGVLVFLVLVALFAPVVAPYDPVRSVPQDALLPPSAVHLFGTDSYGFDIFSRVLYATRTDLTVAIASVLLGVAIGLPLGALAALTGGFIDNVMMRVVEVVQAFPQILFAMVVFAAVGVSTVNLIGVLALLNVPVYVRLVRSVGLPLRDAEFVLAARLAGSSTSRIVLQQFAPNLLVPVFSQFSISAAFAIQMVAGLSFLGLGVPVPQPEWGSMIQIGASYIIFGQWWPALFPGIAVFLASYALTGIGNEIRQAVIKG